MGAAQGHLLYVCLPNFTLLCGSAPLILQFDSNFWKILNYFIIYVLYFKVFLFNITVKPNSSLNFLNALSTVVKHLHVLTPVDYLHFIAHKVKGVRSSLKQLKLTEYYKSKLVTYGILFV